MNTNDAPGTLPPHFATTIHFDKVPLSSVQQLVWLCTFGGRPGLAHHLGMGRALGYGSVRLEAATVRIRKLHPHGMRFRIMDLTQPENLRQMLRAGAIGFARDRTGMDPFPGNQEEEETAGTLLHPGHSSGHHADNMADPASGMDGPPIPGFHDDADVRSLMRLHRFSPLDGSALEVSDDRQAWPRIRYPLSYAACEHPRDRTGFFSNNRNGGDFNTPYPVHQVLQPVLNDREKSDMHDSSDDLEHLYLEEPDQPFRMPSF